MKLIMIFFLARLYTAQYLGIRENDDGLAMKERTEVDGPGVVAESAIAVYFD